MSYNAETGMYEGYIYCITNTVNNKIYIGQTRTTIKQRWKHHRVDSKNKNTALYCAMRKYGIKKFTIQQIIALSSKSVESLKNSLNLCERYFIAKYDTLCGNKGYNLTKGGDAPYIFAVTPVDHYDLQLNYIQSYESIQEASVATGIKEQTIRRNCEHRQATACGFIFCRKGEIPKRPEYTINGDYNIDNINLSKYDNNEVLKLMLYGWNGKRVVQYNVYGEIINIFDNPLDAADKLGISTCDVKFYFSSRSEKLGGKQFNNTLLKYEGENFTNDDLYEKIRPVAAYDLNGKYVMRFPNKQEADRYFNVCEGSVGKAIKRGGSCKGYLFSYYGEPIKRKLRCRDLPVEMVDNNGNIIKTFPTMKSVCEYYDIDCYKAIRKAIKSHSIYKEHYWKYKDGVTIS